MMRTMYAVWAHKWMAIWVNMFYMMNPWNIISHRRDRHEKVRTEEYLCFIYFSPLQCNIYNNPASIQAQVQGPILVDPSGSLAGRWSYIQVEPQDADANAIPIKITQNALQDIQIQGNFGWPYKNASSTWFHKMNTYIKGSTTDKLNWLSSRKWIAPEKFLI